MKSDLLQLAFKGTAHAGNRLTAPHLEQSARTFAEEVLATFTSIGEAAAQLPDAGVMDEGALAGIAENALKEDIHDWFLVASDDKAQLTKWLTRLSAGAGLVSALLGKEVIDGEKAEHSEVDVALAETLLAAVVLVKLKGSSVGEALSKIGLTLAKESRPQPGRPSSDQAPS